MIHPEKKKKKMLCLSRSSCGTSFACTSKNFSDNILFPKRTTDNTSSGGTWLNSVFFCLLFPGGITQLWYFCLLLQAAYHSFVIFVVSNLFVLMWKVMLVQPMTNKKCGKWQEREDKKKSNKFTHTHQLSFLLFIFFKALFSNRRHITHFSTYLFWYE